MIADVRATFEATVLRWPEVRTKQMFGCPCYLANDKLFAFFVADGLVLTKLSDADRRELAAEEETQPFRSGTRTIQSWIQVTVNAPDDLNVLMPYVTGSYEVALEQSYTETT